MEYCDTKSYIHYKIKYVLYGGALSQTDGNDRERDGQFGSLSHDSHLKFLTDYNRFFSRTKIQVENVFYQF